MIWSEKVKMERNGPAPSGGGGNKVQSRISILPHKQPSRRSVAKTENTRNVEEIEKYYPVLKFNHEPQDEPFAIVIDLADLNVLSYRAIYDAIGHIFPKENVRDKITSIQFQNMNIQTNSDNKRERWIVQVRVSEIFGNFLNHFEIV